MAKDEPKDTRTLDDRMLAIQEENQRLQREQLEFQREQLRIQTLQAENARITAEATAKRLKPKSLEIGEIAQASAFNPRGEKDHPMPRLKCDIYAPWKLEPNNHSLTREEVELFNLLEPNVYHITLNDGQTCAMTVVGVKNNVTGRLEQLSLQPDPGWTQENKQRFPSMAAMLREMVDGAGVLTMKKERALIASGELSVSVQALA